MDAVGEARVKALYIYPVKSCRGVAVSQASITTTGSSIPVATMVEEVQGGTSDCFETQRNNPKLALIQVTMPAEALDSSWGSLPHDAALCLNAPGMEPLYVPLIPSLPLRKVEKVTCWEWSGPALSEGVDADRWVSEYLGKPSHFVRFDIDNTSRLTDPDYAVGYKVSFSDGYPFLLISQASLDSLNERLQEDLPINRFRPNIFVEGCEAFAEDKWDTFTIGKSTFHGVKICGRCKVTTIDQQSAEVGKEPLQVLKTFRAGPHLADIRAIKNEVFFGQNVTCEDPGLSAHGIPQEVRVGDIVQVLKTASIMEIMS